MQLTNNGEVAVFIDDNQFGSGQSTDKCGPEAVAMVWHSVQPGQKNPYTANDVHAMAHADYEKFIGPDNPGDTGGTSNQTLYNMLSEHKFLYQIGEPSIAWVKDQLSLGRLVIVGIVESSVADLDLNANPYNWNTEGLTHIIVASGPGQIGQLLVRDTANIAPNGVRPGPRRYDAGKLQLISATSVVPTWLQNNPVPAPDTYADVLAAWNAGGQARAPFVPTSAIPASYAKNFRAGRYFGQPQQTEQSVSIGGIKHAQQSFTAALADWNSQTGQITWHTASGIVAG